MNAYENYTTYREIAQQPRLWRETYETIQSRQEDIARFLKRVSSDKDLRVILSGAGSSAFIGETVAPYINTSSPFVVEPIATTDIVAAPEAYFRPKRPTLLVSYARSGNSPESVATVDLADALIDEVYHIILTCNREGSLARRGEEDDNALVVYMPEAANDKGLAMTGSFSTMALASLLLFNLDAINEHAKTVDRAAGMAKKVMTSETLDAVAASDFKKAVFLGSAPFKGLAKEAELKMLELNAGRIATRSDTPLGFRHGPKSFIDEKTTVFQFLSNDDYTRKYERDLLEELEGDGMTQDVVFSEGYDESIAADRQVTLADAKTAMPDAFLLFPYLVAAQRLAFLKSYKQGINPDDPSPEGVINRVVKGVRLYPYPQEDT